MEAAAQSSRILKVEEHSVLGVLGGAVAEVLAGEGLPFNLNPPRHLRRVQPDRAAYPSLSAKAAREELRFACHEALKATFLS
nr:hypothetical protein [Sinorhizobium sp. NFACC03]